MNNSLLRITLIATLATLLLLTACSQGGSPTQSDSIQGVIWQWANVTNQSTQEITVVPNPENYTLTFNADGSLNGKADCNTFTGIYSQENGFSITLGATTAMACGDASLDQQYLQLLGSAAAGGPDGLGNLALETAGGAQRMLFQNGGEATN